MGKEIIKYLVLFFAPLAGGLLVYVIPKGKHTHYKLLMVFAGSYLFSITVTHILPELYEMQEDVRLIGVYVLAGFFLQQILEYFTSGVEHGHLPASAHDDHEGHHHHHHHTHEGHTVSAVVLLIALCIHAFLEGGMLTQPAEVASAYNLHAVLLGITLHRVPAAFALVAVLRAQLPSGKSAFYYLILFSLAAPAGLLLSNFLTTHHILEAEGLVYLYALVSGNFLYISTTIVFESSPEHRFNAKKLLVAVAGATLALMAEMVG